MNASGEGDKEGEAEEVEDVAATVTPVEEEGPVNAADGGDKTGGADISHEGQEILPHAPTPHAESPLNVTAPPSQKWHQTSAGERPVYVSEQVWELVTPYLLPQGVKGSTLSRIFNVPYRCWPM